jgi:hypothetical protein
MNDHELSLIFGKTSVWEFHINNECVESLQFAAPDNFITGEGRVYRISNIDVCLTSGVLSFDKKVAGEKSVKAKLVFIKDKSTLVGFEGSKQVKYIKTAKRTFH